MRLRYLAALIAAGMAFVLTPGMAGHAARAKTAGTPTIVSAFGCIVINGGHVNRPAGSTIVIRQGFGEFTRGILQDFLNAQFTIVSVNDAPMFDVSDQWSPPAQQPDGGWLSRVVVPTGVTLANPGDQMRFTFTLVIAGKVPEVVPGEGPVGFNGPGLSFGGTCTVTAT